ncbi:MAG: DUF444 family protein [Candidatus Nealsonbacteria bacterium]|nr:DUF444 family protein [Candidatus Nealsonbacteria bacterium]
MSRIIRIKEDEKEFLDIVKGKIRKDLKKYLGRGKIHVHRRGDQRTVEIPVDELEIPTLRYGFPPDFSMGQGEGNPGDDLGPVQQGEDGEGEKGEGGQGHGSRKVIVEIPENEFIDYFQEILELPRIQPKGDRSIFEEKEKYSTLSHIGPKSLLHRRRTFKEAMKRSVATGDFQPPDKTNVVIHPKDQWYRSYQKIREPKNNAVIFYMRDVSGSMGAREREVVSYLCDLCDFWLSWNYDGLEKVYIIHDDVAEECPTKEEFFTVNFGGGTSCSSAQKLAAEIIEQRFPVSKWNIYIVYLSDGMNYGEDDKIFVKVLQDQLLPIVNQYAYGQIQLQRSWWGSYQKSDAKVFSPPGTLGKLIEDELSDHENIAQATIDSEEPEAIVDAIKSFFGKGN